MTNNSTRDKIIELARNYIQTIGYHSFNYKMISNDLNIKNSSIHHYFPSKDDLAVAVIEKDKMDFSAMAKSLESQSPAEKAQALLNNYDDYFNNGKKLCLISTFGSSYNDISEKIQNASSAYAVLVKKWLSEIFKDGLLSKEFHFKQSPEDMAIIWMATLPGSLLVGRMHGAVHFDKVIGFLKSTLLE
ncbi:TetR/AcrR family transcriptional repressor of nem operon [Pedobacter cryoconitis]|uniref:TetR/AcrR family transcriptional regulator n=1 Tax=Pedobacter cryoconitis TaxID=188932 RepID=UPI0016186596|nr:TetR/AcrR family transcriptional regulator [Pedobacter cryoconitis]MBB6271735.1 TetR/AcrR family transcriptional repressor of nem operon [Pedobacter cryoconitis]